MSKKATILAICGLSIGLYLFSLSQPCFCTEKECGEAGEGIALFISGWFGWFSCAEWFAWLANPAIIISWIYFNKNPRTSLIASIIAVITALYFLTVKEIMVNEAGNFSPIESYQIGYWLWLSSMIAGLIAAIINYFNDRSRLQQRPKQ